MAVKKIETLNKHENPATNENQFDIENYMNVNWDKIREVVDNNADELTTTQGKATTLETDNKKNKQDISDIKSNQTTQNDLLERTQSALINITTEKSSNINVKDSSNLNAKIGVFGISEQETREGYNLLNVASTCEITGSKTVPISMPAGNYTIKADDITTDSEQTQFCFSFRDSSGTIADARISLSTKKITFALTREATSVVIYSGNSFNESQGVTTTYKNLMIYEGADDKVYEEYGKTPSLEISSEIENTGDNINLFDSELELGFIDGTGAVTSDSNCVRSKNFINIKENETYTISNDKNYSNILFTYNESKELISNLGDVSTFKTPKNTKYIKFRSSSGQKENDLSVKYKIEKGNKATSYSPYKCGNIDITVCNKNFLNVNSECKVIGSKTVAIKMPIGTYTIKADDIVTDSEQTQFCFSFRNSSGTIADARISLSTKKITFTINREATLVYVYAGNSYNESQGVTTTYKNLMIYKETDDEQYTEHEQQLITFPLAQGQKLYDKDYLASDGIHHVKKQIELVGTENWFKNETTKIFGFALSDIKTEGAFNSSARIVVMSNYFKAAKYYQLYYGEVDEAISGHDSSQAVELRATRFTTIEELKTWLTEQKEAGTPVILEYELAEEEIEPYTDEQQEAYDKLQNVLSYKTETNVFTDKAQLVFKYIADTQTWAVNLVKSEVANTNQQLLNIAGGN